MKLNKEQILSIVRQILTTVGAVLVTTGFLQDGVYYELIGTTMTLISTIWSVVDKNDSNMAQKFESFKARQKK